MWFFPLIGPVLGYAAAGASAVVAGLGWGWRRSDLGRARARAGRALRPIRKEARRFEAGLARWTHPLRPAARAFARHQRAKRMQDVPLESLREAGAKNVRWSALEEAGYLNLADVRGRTGRDLAKVRGIGRKTGGRVARAARRVAARLREEPIRLPAADLDGKGAVELAAGALDLLEAQETAGIAAQRLASRARMFEKRWHEVRRRTSFGRWLLSPFRRSKNEAAQLAANTLADEAESAGVRDLLEEAKEGRERLRRWKPRKRSPEAIRGGFRDRHAACCAVLDEIFGEVGLRAPRAVSGGQGGVTDEVAMRVEAFPLSCPALRATLRPYQEFGAKYVLAQERTILGDEMGLGKTMQALAAMVHLDEKERAGGNGAARFFVVAPAGLLINWSREIEKFTPLAAHVLHGDELERSLARWITEGGVAVTSYATLRNADLGAVLETRKESVELCAIDEAHFVKNPEAGRTQAVCRLLDRSAYAVLLSGTPMENHPSEFLHLIDAIRPRDAADLRAQNLELDAAAGSVHAFHRAVAKVYLRRNQEDVLTELPERIEVEEWIDLSPGDRSAYREMVRAGNFMGMRRAATLGDPETPSAKLERIAELLEDHRESGRKVIVFSFFLDVLAACAGKFETVGTISGKLGPQEKQELCDEFQSRDGHAILLLQINAGGQGLNLQAASAVVLTEPQVKPTVEAQAVARAHRMGQTQRVLVHRLLARETCDETMLAMLAEKSELFDAYAKKSLVKEASRQATATSFSRAVIEAEQDRLTADFGSASPRTRA